MQKITIAQVWPLTQPSNRNGVKEKAASVAVNRSPLAKPGVAFPSSQKPARANAALIASHARYDQA